MAQKLKAYKITSISELPEEYEIMSVKKDGYFVHKEHRDALVILEVKDENSIYAAVIVNVSSQYKMIYKDYIERLSNNNIDFKILKSEDDKIISSIYAGHHELNDDELEKFDSDVIDEVNDLIYEAIKINVSDVHIEVREKLSKIRFRKNGSLYTKSQINYTRGKKMGIVLYQALSTESGVVFNPSVPQDAMVDSKFGGIRARLRIATAPASPSGFDMVIRILKFGENTTYTLLTELGYTPEQSKRIYTFSTDPVGATIIAGTTGSGKSTTLKNIITKKIMDHKATLKVITVEDPPEYEIPHATQIPVIRDDTGSAKQGFSSAIRTAMRSDPDVLMIGEIRDNQSAELLVGATQSGHQVLSTVHAASAVGIVARLESLGISRDVLSSSDFISGFIYQKLLPKNCPNCSIPYKNANGTVNTPVTEASIALQKNYCTEKELEQAQKSTLTTSISRALQDLMVIDEARSSELRHTYKEKSKEFNESGFEERLIDSMSGNTSGVRYRGAGCEKCEGTGISGRMVIAEILEPTKEILISIKSGNDLETKRIWKESTETGTIMDVALRRIAEGVVDPIDVEKEIGTLKK